MGATVTTDRTFRFGAARGEVWDALAATDRYREWWPWLTEFAAPGLYEGAVWHCGVRSPLHTTLRFRLHIDAAQNFAVVARLDGDLEGSARLTLHAAKNDAARLRLEAQVTPTLAPVAAMSRLVPALAQWSHDRIISTGARQFANALDRDLARGAARA